ncbi:hypothetical protein DFH09DRAFT_1467602 [Mycena vulgaris]|nr:hypothetical protein DFH09DRAFT_1467602 [Mycena vulgaris]
MSTSSSPSRVSGQTVLGKAMFRLFKSSSQARSNWLSTSLLTAKAITAGAECLPFPYVKGIFGMVVAILKTVENVKKNRDDLKELCGNIMDIIRIVENQILRMAIQLLVLQGVLEAVKQMQTEPRSLSSRLKEVVKLSSTADELAGYRTRIQELRSWRQWIQTCKFTIWGSLQMLLQHQPLKQSPSVRLLPGYSRADRISCMNNNIYLLYGLGGAGKTQIALKFIEESSWFSDIFLIDTSTAETIDTGLKNIAATHNAGSTAQDGLEWLSSKPAEWLLFFDNADDLHINLNKFFPRCKHGNILITSRNPRLRVYAGSHSQVSDMEEPDAVALLLKSSVQDVTTRNLELANEIVKTVYTTWQISFEQLSKPAATILQLCSFLHYKGISEEIFSSASSYRFRSSGPSKEELGDPLEFLAQFSGQTGVWNCHSQDFASNSTRERIGECEWLSRKDD